ncbi:putative hemolysin [Sulfuritortus calidifontis]|uniref:Putative hemolysin n=1 Tax=Sulfuritortus calidifontis TaxID=1914471 RepID=A0A4R3JUW6_9PROT|nr:hemolysin family protein [Sulfuritortus calidifontis]TCS71704.1 putative hemolysin [Sulfuritortus calidifontis]
MEILFLLALILLNGLFSMSELALATVRRARLARLAEGGDKAAGVALALHDTPTRYLSTVQIGITSIGILSGIVGEAALASPLAGWLQTRGLAPDIGYFAATALVVVLITYVSIVIGEIVPKRLAQFHPEAIARWVARPILGLALITRPFVLLLSVSTDGLLRLLGKRGQSAPSVTEEEIHALLEEGSEAGVIERKEHEMVRNVFRLDERLLGSLMIPRADIVYLDLARPLEQNLRIVTESGHARFPVCRGGLDEVLGIVDTRQLLNLTLQGKPIDLAGLVQTEVFVPESLTGLELLEHFRSTGIQMVLVVDEYGELQGLVTLYDVLESVTGEFVPHGEAEAWAVQREDGSWLLDGLIPIPELKDQLGLKTVPEEEKGRYHTLSGLVMWLLGRLPQTGDVATWENWRLEVIDLDGKRIDKVLATRIPDAPRTQA